MPSSTQSVEAVYDGPDDKRLIFGHTNPWLRDTLTGVDLDLLTWQRTGRIPLAQDFSEAGCYAGCFAGVLTNMDTPQGVQACDACETFDSDLAAAQHLADAINAAQPALEVVVIFEVAA
jgi:hypothetical protein